MPEGGTLGSGVRVLYAPTSPHVWVEVEDMLDAVPPQFVRDRVDVSTHGTTGLRRFIPGLADVTDSTIRALADLERSTTPSHLGLRDLERSQTLTWFRIAIPTQANLATTPYMVYEYQARVSAWGVTAPIDAAKELNVTLQFGGTDVTLYESLATPSS